MPFILNKRTQRKNRDLRHANIVWSAKISYCARENEAELVHAMTGQTCIVCGSTHSQDPSVSFHRLPSDPGKRASWLCVFAIDERRLKSQSRVCSRHFPDGDTKKEPLANLGKRFASPIKSKHPRAKRANARASNKALADLRSSVSPSPKSTWALQDIRTWSARSKIPRSRSYFNRFLQLVHH